MTDKTKTLDRIYMKFFAEKSIFPPPEKADPDGIVGFSRQINCRMLADAYYNGIFPWPFAEDELIPWVCPHRRGVIMMNEFHVPKSLQREMKKFPFSLKINHDFNAVITNCATSSRPEQQGTWITSQLIRVYNEFHRLGYAHSFESYMPDGTLAGGLYGISTGRIFCGESMFFKISGASKFAFVKMVEILKSHNVELIDTQMVTNATASFGAKEIPSAEYLKLLHVFRGAPLRLADQFPNTLNQ